MLFLKLDQELVRLPKQLEVVEQLRTEMLQPVFKMPASLRKESALLIGAASIPEFAEHDFIKHYFQFAVQELRKKGSKRCFITCSNPELFRILQLKGMKSIKRIKKGKLEAHLLELRVEGENRPRL